MKRLFFLLLFFVFTPLTLFASILGLRSFDQAKETAYLNPQGAGSILGVETSLALYSALPPTISTLDQTVTREEARHLIIKKYLERYQSPVSAYYQQIFEASERWGIDYRLIPAIAQCESNLCKKIPSDSYNCWGFGNGEMKFSSWEEAFEKVAKTLKLYYIDQGLITPEQIMPKYVPPSVKKGGPWAKCVNQYLQELD